MYFSESWQFLVNATILLRMVPSGTPQFAAASQETQGLCALMANPRKYRGKSSHNQHECSESSSLLIFTGEKTDGQRKGVVCGSLQKCFRDEIRSQIFHPVTPSWPFLFWDFIQYSKYLWETSSCIGVGYFQYFKGFSTFLLEKISLEPSLS